VTKTAVTPLNPPYRKNPMLHAKFMAVRFIETTVIAICRSKFYIAGREIFDLLVPVTLTLTQ